LRKFPRGLKKVSEAFAETRAVIAAQSELCAIAHENYVIAMKIRL
jgi:hypothetical protein